MTTTAIVLSGGGAHGDFEVGALKFLYKFLNSHGISKPDIICGTSVGSINGVKLAEGEWYPGRRTDYLWGLQGMENIWLNLQKNSDMWREEDWLASIDPKIRQILNMTAIQAAINVLFDFIIPFKLIFDLVNIGIDISKIMDVVKKMQTGSIKSIFNLNPIREKLNNPNLINLNEVSHSGIKLRLAAVSLESGECRYITEEGRVIGMGTPLQGDLFEFYHGPDPGPWRLQNISDSTLSGFLGGTPYPIWDGNMVRVFRRSNTSPTGDKGRLLEYYLSDKWYVVDHSSETSAPPIAGDPMAVWNGSDSSMHIYVRSFNNHLLEFIKSSTSAAWTVSDISSLIGGTLVSGDPMAVWNGSDSSMHIYVRSFNNHLLEFIKSSTSAAWTVSDISSLIGGTLVSGDPMAVWNGSDSSMHIYVRGINILNQDPDAEPSSHLLEFIKSSTSAAWTVSDISSLIGGTLVSGDPMAVYNNRLIFVYARSSNNSLLEFIKSSTSAAWTVNNISTTVGGNSAFISGNPFVIWTDSKHIYAAGYGAVENHLLEFYFTNTWHVIDHSSEVGGSLITGTPMPIFINNFIRIFGYGIGKLPVSLVDAVLASAGIPGLFPPIKLYTENYVDGGVREQAPIEAAIDAGADQIYVILASKTTLDPYDKNNPSFDNKNILDIAQRAVMDIMPNEGVINDVYPINGWGPSLKAIIQPTIDVHDFMTIDPGLIRITIDYGYMVSSYILKGSSSNRQGSENFVNTVALIRKQIWDSECIVNNNGEPFLFGYDESGTNATPQFDINALNNSINFIRQKKRELKAIVTGYVGYDGELPDGCENWWNKWEAHPWPIITQTPWDKGLVTDSITGQQFTLWEAEGFSSIIATVQPSLIPIGFPVQVTVYAHDSVSTNTSIASAVMINGKQVGSTNTPFTFTFGASDRTATVNASGYDPVTISFSLYQPHLYVHVTPYPIKLVATSVKIDNLTIYSEDSQTHSPVQGRVIMDGKDIGSTNTPFTFTFQERRIRVFDPDLRKWVYEFTNPSGIVTASGYPNASIDFGFL